MQHAGKTSLICSRSVKWLTQIDQQLFNPPNGALMPFHLPLPAMAERIFYQLLFYPVTTAQPGCVRWGGYEFGTGEVQLAFTWALLGKPEATSQFEFRFEKIFLNPLEIGGRQIACPQSFCTWSSHRGSWTKDGLIVLANHWIANLSVHHRHMGTGMTQDRHNRMKLGPFLGQMFSHRMAEAMGGDSCFPF